MSSSTFVADSSDDKDNQLIIIVNADGTITVDPETLEKIIANQHHGSNLSVVRVGDGNTGPEDNQDDDRGGPHVNLTVEGFYSENDPEIQQLSSSDTNNEAVDPFSQMGPEHLARIESVLQSEQAREILGTNIAENQDLNSMLDLLEGREEAPTARVVHNDHSYTSTSFQAPAPPAPPPPPPTPVVPHRPLTRGGRGRGRGRGIMTRGGSRGGGTQSQVTVNTPRVILQAPAKVISPQKTYIVAQPRRIVAQPLISQRVVAEPVSMEEVVSQPTEQPAPSQPSVIQLQSPSTPRLIQRKLVAKPVLKQQTLHQVLAPQPTIVTTPESNRPIQTPSVVKVITATPVTLQTVQKKVISPRGRGGRGSGRGGRGGRKSQASPTTAVPTATIASPPTIPTPATGDEVSAALEAMELSPPQTPSVPTTPPKVVPGVEVGVETKKKTPTMVIRKLGSGKSEVVSKGRQQEQPASVVSQPPAKPSPTEATPSPRGGKEVAGSEEVKKKREKKAPPAAVAGPELFSTPDIIRRVSTDKAPETAPPEPLEPKVQVQPTHPPLAEPSFDMEMTPESLLDSIHAEVAAKDDSRLLAEALLLDDLTNDDSDMTYPGKEKVEVLKVIPSKVRSPSPVSPTKASPENLVQSPSNTNQRVRKLPPIELPTTRSASKKAAANQKPQQQQQPQLMQTPVSSKTSAEKEKKRGAAGAVSEKRQSSETKRVSEKKYSLKDEFVSDFEDEIESDQESWNSEDDPDRLWCICKKPHNNRFMICCDSCEEWFHGKCVGITKALGRQMEQEGTEWSCPNCKAKKEAPLAESTKPVAPKLPSGQQTISSLECLVCKKPARTGSNYCSEMCIKKHALNMIALLNSEIEGLTSSSRVIVYEKSSGRIISNDGAPTVSNLADWLSEHPTFEVHKSSISNSVYKKKQEPSPPQVSKKQAKTHQQSEVKPVKVVLKQQQLPQHLTKQSPKQAQPKSVTHSKPPAEEGESKGKSKVLTPSPTKAQQAQAKQAPPPLKSPPPSKQNEKDRPNLKQTLITNKINQSGAKEVTSKQPGTPKQIQIIQAQPLPPPPVQTKEKKGKEKKEEDEEYKPKKTKVVEKPQQEARKSSIENRKQSTEKQPAEKPPKEEKRRDSTSSKDSGEKKKEEKKRERKNTEKSEETATAVSSSEPIRANVKRTIQELLNQRVRQDSMTITNEEVKELAVSIEEALFAYFKDTGTKYKAKYRSLLFNIKDPKNLTLYKKIVEKAISPEQLVKLSPEELASQELAQWREKEAKHQLDIIKKNELDLIQQAKTVVLKSRKGEEVIETTPRANISDIEKALNRTADDWELENAVITDPRNDEEVKQLQKKQKDQSRRDRKRSSSSRDEKKRDRSRSRSRHRRSRSSSRDRDKRRKEKDREKEKASKTEETLKEIEEVISQHVPPPVVTPQQVGGADSDMSDREPSSTVNNTPPPPEPEKTPVWRGFLNMAEVTKLCTSAYEVSGSCQDLSEEIPEELECVGRIQPASVWEYVSRMKKAGTKDIVVIRFHSVGAEENMNYLALYSYLNSKNRMAVIGSVCQTVKDFYVFPLASHSPIPQVLLPLDGPGFDEYRTHLLLGIIVRSKKTKKTPDVSSSMMTISSSFRTERSYTPPLPDSGFTDSHMELPDSGSTTPPLPAYKASFPSGLTPPLPEEDEPYSPGESYSPDDSRTEAILVNPEIQRNLEEVNKLIDEKCKQIRNLSQAAQGSKMDDDAPYSPSSSMSPPPQESNLPPYLDTNVIKLPPDLQDILASIKGPTGSQQPVMDVKSDPIVKAYKSQGMYYEEEEEKEEEVRPSRDPRQRPESKSVPCLPQFSDQDLLRKAVEMESETTLPYYYPPHPPPHPPPPPPVYAPPPPYKAYPPPPPPEKKRKERRGPPHSNPRERDLGPPPRHRDLGLPRDRDIGPPRDRDIGPPRERDIGPPRDLGPPRHKWDGGNHHRGGPPHRGMRGGRFRGGFGGRGGGFRGNGGFRQHRPPHRFRGGGGGGHRNVQSEWDEEIRKFEQRKARERKRKSSRSPSPRRHPSPSRRRARRASSNSS